MAGEAYAPDGLAAAGRTRDCFFPCFPPFIHGGSTRSGCTCAAEADDEAAALAAAISSTATAAAAAAVDAGQAEADDEEETLAAAAAAAAAALTAAVADPEPVPPHTCSSAPNMSSNSPELSSQLTLAGGTITCLLSECATSSPFALARFSLTARTEKVTRTKEQDTKS